MTSNLASSNQIAFCIKTCRDCNVRFEADIASLFGRFPVRARDFKGGEGRCPECQEKENQRWSARYFARDLYWTYDSVKMHFRNNPPKRGDQVLILDTSKNNNTYVLVKIRRPNHTPQKRIVVSSSNREYSGLSFYRSGKCCIRTKSKIRLLPYHEQIGQAIAERGIEQQIVLPLGEIPTLIGLKPDERIGL